ncbi:hypothetical protein DSCO28_33480 [Desulfosarcina ovata subsp. sediminis]|uniref:Methyltransferase FkbM domain-containing protein n=1 Tax=Desulfosarcina ovata subsp. sediminis TaxID=885957 RepID=A0A5K7ZKT5_9BACT|nr:FkbM family methyltransferase [Desulfosarcina ovata]BBO82782.1 hypothetical protein DSCO28_33480 [Desulfosarcina ovata subsp. sediminis]
MKRISRKLAYYRYNIGYYYITVGIRGLFLTAVALLSKKVKLIRMKRRDIMFPFILRVPTSDVPTFHQVFVAKDYDFKVITRPKIIIDAGANIGLAAIVFASRFPDAKIIAIEPEAENFSMLCDNVRPYPNIVPVQAALWNQNTQIDIIDPGLGNWGFRVNGGNADAVTTRHRVQAVTVDTILETYNLDFVDILKVDIEGAEREVFHDATAWIERVGSMIVELHENIIPGCEESFYRATKHFGRKMAFGDNVYLSRPSGCISIV